MDNLFVNGRKYVVEYESKYYVAMTSPVVAAPQAMADLDSLLERGYVLHTTIHRSYGIPACLVFRKTKVALPS